MADLGNVGYQVDVAAVAVYGYGARLGVNGDYSHVSGTTKVEGVAAAGLMILAFARSDGGLIGRSRSDAAGNFAVPLWHAGPVKVVALHDSRNALVFDHITPV